MSFVTIPAKINFVVCEGHRIIILTFLQSDPVGSLRKVYSLLMRIFFLKEINGVNKNTLMIRIRIRICFVQTELSTPQNIT